MAVDWDADVLAPLMAVFGEDVQPVFTPAASQPGAPSYTIDGVFDDAYVAVSLLDAGSPATTVKPVLGVRLAQFAVPPIPSDQVFIASVGVNFVLREVQPDGHGWAKLMLGRITP